MKFKKINKGYTLTEILVVMGISIIILSVVVSYFYSLVKIQALDKDYTSVVSLVDQAKSLSINSKSASQYGVYFASSTAVLFKGSNYISTSTANQIYTLNNRVSISNIDLEGSSTSQVLFSRLTGYANASGTVSVSLKDGSGSPKVIRIYRTGTIELN